MHHCRPEQLWGTNRRPNSSMSWCRIDSFVRAILLSYTTRHVSLWCQRSLRRWTTRFEEDFRILKIGVLKNIFVPDWGCNIMYVTLNTHKQEINISNFWKINCGKLIWYVLQTSNKLQTSNTSSYHLTVAIVDCRNTYIRVVGSFSF